MPNPEKTITIPACPAVVDRKPHGQHRIPGTQQLCLGVGEPIVCIAKLAAPMRECGKPVEFLTKEQAAAHGHIYSGWYHVDLDPTTTLHHAVPRSWAA